MDFILNLITFLFFVFGTIFCMLTTNKNRGEIKRKIFENNVPTEMQNDKLESIFIRTNALGVFLIILGIGFVIARIF